ncbi:MAG: hypothetical protein FWF47_06850 [Clostridia bacterium]|nr:hypothetical protein [Clostridia bacterium]
MCIKQLSVFIENKPGSLADITGLLGENDIDLFSLSIADTAQFGILRAIVADYEKARRLIAEAGYTVKLTDVLAVAVHDSPGELAGILRLLAESRNDVEYLYSSVRNAGESALIIFRVKEPELTARFLADKGVRLLTQEEISVL